MTRGVIRSMFAPLTAAIVGCVAGAALIAQAPDRSRPPVSLSKLICASGRNPRTMSASSPRLIVWPPVL